MKNENLKNKTLKTPSAQGSILAGITRDSVLKIAEKILKRKISSIPVIALKNMKAILGLAILQRCLLKSVLIIQIMIV
jgi:branched-subunit amino acid aminotransferase/4-amino-4-deoxychorismate lyase